MNNRTGPVTVGPGYPRGKERPLDEAVDGTKELLGETVRAFKTGLKGEEYVPFEQTEPETESHPGSPSDPDKYDRLAKLNDLRLSGALTEEEFEREKHKLLES
jgi:hypothetical protein